MCFVLDEDGAVEVEDAEGVLQQLDEALDTGIISEADLTHTLKNTFKISEKVKKKTTLDINVDEYLYYLII